jgi:hypothetical protein
MGLPRKEWLRCRLDMITISIIMKKRKYLYRRIIPGMDIVLLNTTNDIKQLRAISLAMVQKAVDENHNLQLQKNAKLTSKDQRIRLLEEALILPRQQRFGRKIEMQSGQQRQLFEEDTEVDIAGAETQMNALQQQDIKENAEKSSALYVRVVVAPIFHQRA